MIVTKDTSVDFPFFIIKDFLSNPQELRKIILDAPFKNDDGVWVGRNTILHPNYQDYLYGLAQKTACEILNDYVWSPEQAIDFRKLDDPNYPSPTAAHVDRFFWYDFDKNNRPIYNNYMHWSFILDCTPIQNSARLCFCEDLEGSRYGTFEESKSSKIRDYSQWKIYKDFYYSYNTAVMFPSNLWHTARDFVCSKEVPRTMFASWFFSGFNAKYNKCGIPQIDK